MQSTYAASIMRDRRRSIISFRRTNFPSDITAFARLTFLLPSFFFFLLFLFRRPRGNGRRKKRENSAIFHNDIANLILHWLLLLLPRNTKFFDTLLYSLSLSSSKPAFSISIFSRPKEERNSKISTANVHQPAELNDGGTGERQPPLFKCTVCADISFWFAPDFDSVRPSVCSCLAVIRFRVKLLTESRRGEKKKKIRQFHAK